MSPVDVAETKPAARFDRRLIPAMLLGAILNPINSSMIAVALIPIGTALGAPPAQTAWLVSALYLATATGQPVIGRLVDMYGPRRLYLVSTALVGVAGVAGVLAPNLGVLIAARVLLGFGTCAGYPAAMYLIRSESRRTGLASPAGVLTALAVSTQTVAVVGPSLGGLLIAVGGWRATFAVNIPLALACLILGWRTLPHNAEAARGRRIDVPGMLLFAGTLTALMLFLMSPHPHTAYLLALAVVAGAALTLRELRTTDPFIDLRVLRGNAPLIATYARTVLTYSVSYSFLYGFTPWLEAGRGLTPSGAGLVLLPMFAVGIVVSTVTGRRAQVRAKLLVGAATQGVVCVMLLLVVTSASPIWALVGLAMALGVPQGLISLANQNALYHQADPDRIASSAGLLRTFMYLGAMLASAATASFFGPHADTAGLHELAWFMLPCSVLLLLVSVLDRSLRRVGRSDQAADAGSSG